MSDLTVQAFAKKLEQVTDEALRRTIRGTLQLSLDSMVANVVRNKMSGQLLGVVTGTARRSIASEIRETPDSIIGAFGSPLRYVRAHELGFHGAVSVRAHTRRGYAVSAHQRIMNLRARNFLREALNEGIPGLARRVVRGLRILIETGTPPAVTELGA